MGELLSRTVLHRGGIKAVIFWRGYLKGSLYFIIFRIPGKSIPILKTLYKIKIKC